ncbi:Hypothetical Protein OBI_RACECAR_201 [Arthrobacter phage Racecar]|nr:hypothetical protein PBI_RACECAR_283 [Arthrobacter phage Racecar]QFG12922.1 hypothetical protein PBI_MIMI_280 [Arthrobacter phage Mimi]
MAELTGEKIESLLWDNGCEARQKYDEETDSLTITVEDFAGSVITISEAWYERDGEWYVDSDTLVLEMFTDGEKVAEDLTVVYSEEELVQQILKLGGEN